MRQTVGRPGGTLCMYSGEVTWKNPKRDPELWNHKCTYPALFTPLSNQRAVVAPTPTAFFLARQSSTSTSRQQSISSLLRHSVCPDLQPQLYPSHLLLRPSPFCSCSFLPRRNPLLHPTQPGRPLCQPSKSLHFVGCISDTVTISAYLVHPVWPFGVAQRFKAHQF